MQPTLPTPTDDDLEPIPDDLSGVDPRAWGTPPPPPVAAPTLTDEQALTVLWQALKNAPPEGVGFGSRALEQATGRKKSWLYEQRDPWERHLVKVTTGRRVGYRLAPDAPEHPPVLTRA